jgi:ethanolamine transporter EutH
MVGFSLVWLGQMVSVLASNMTGFGLTIWAYEKTGLATSLALIGFFFVTPLVVVSPMAGAIVLSLATMASGWIREVWHLYFLCGVLAGLGICGLGWVPNSVLIADIPPPVPRCAPPTSGAAHCPERRYRDHGETPVASDAVRWG